MIKIAVVYHSGYGHTAAVAKAVAEGAATQDTAADIINVTELGDNFDKLEQYGALIFGSPTYMGSASAEFKKFMDGSSKAWYGQRWKDKIAGGFTCSASQSGDKLNTLNQLYIFAMQHSMIWVGTGMMGGNNSSTGSVNDLNRIGSFSGLMTQANADQSADIAPPPSDIETAKLFGKRIAEITKRWLHK